MKQDSNSTKSKPGRKRTGSLQFRSGSWYAIVTSVVSGEKIRKWVHLDTDSKPAARRKLARLVAAPDDVDPNEVARTPETYSELATRVNKQRTAAGIVDVVSEEQREALWILPEIGALTVASIRPDHIADIYENARENGRSLSHLRHLRAIMRSRFGVAVQEGTISSSPMDKVKLPKMKTDRRERAVLSDAELVQYLGWQHPDERRHHSVLERQTMSAVARIFGGLRTGDLHTLKWQHLDPPNFLIGVAPRNKTERPQRIEIPEMLRPMLVQWWNTNRNAKTGQNPTAGLVFPALTGESAGTGKKQHVSHAGGLRRDLARVFGLETWNAELHKFEPTKGRDMTPRARELLVETEMTKPVDFHSWRRAFVQAVADIGLNAQQAQKLSGHADLSAYQRYLANTTKTLTIPIEALPDLRVSTFHFYDSRSTKPQKPIRTSDGKRSKREPSQLVVHEKGLEPSRVAPPEPKSGASANSATRASSEAHA